MRWTVLRRAERPAAVVLAGIVSLLAAACDRPGRNGATPLGGTSPGAALAHPPEGLHPDDDPGAVAYADLVRTLGPVSKAGRRVTIGAVVKCLGNPYYQRMADGIYARGKELGLSIAVQAGATESDQEGQRAVLEAMIDRGYDAILVSPQTDHNLVPAVEKAKRNRIPLIDLDSALLHGARCYVGPNHRESGASAAGLARAAGDGEMALIRSVEADYGARERTRGFIDALAGTSSRVVAQPFCVSDLQLALDAAAQILKEHPAIRGFFCDNDVMALGVAQAVERAGRKGEVAVVGRDGIESAYDAVRAGAMSGTVDVLPFETGRIAVEVALRVLQGQAVPRVVRTPQRLATRGSSDGSAPRDRSAAQ